MKRLPFTHSFVACVVLLGLAHAAHAQAQDEPRGYVTKFAIDPNFDKLLKERLANEQELGPLKDLIKKIASDPSKFSVDPAKIKEMKLEDPKFKKALQDWVANDPELRKSLEEWKKRVPPENQPKDVKQFQQELKAILEQKPKEVAPPKELPKQPPIEEKPKVDPLANVTKRAMEQAEESKLGTWLNDSPAWKQAYEDLQASVNRPDRPRMNLGDWQNRFKLPEGAAWKLGEGTLERLRDLPRPNLERVAPALPMLKGFRLPNVSGPSLPNVSTPSMPMMPSLETGATWILLGLIGLFFCWRLLRWRQQAVKRVDGRVSLGPWPVRLDAISTRAELIQAFDYLALLTLGLGVRCWNHHAIARRWRVSDPTCATCALTLAALYEQARYTDGTDMLSIADREQARQSLKQLAGSLT